MKTYLHCLNLYVVENADHQIITGFCYDDSLDATNAHQRALLYHDHQNQLRQHHLTHHVETHFINSPTRLFQKHQFPDDYQNLTVTHHFQTFLNQIIQFQKGPHYHE